MTLTILDFILIIILFFFAFAGFFFGLIHAVGAVVGTLAGVVVAANYFQTVADWVGLPFGLGENWVRIVAFLLIYIVVNRLVGLIFYLIEKVFKMVSILPFFKTFNRLGGFFFGLVEGSLILGVLLVFVVKFPLVSFLVPAIKHSYLAKYLFKIGTWLLPLLPKIFEQVKQTIIF